ncbi:MAG: SRPBCC family protein [Acidobacteria bacterium]|nr:SRPBCC family protein [Acidobacteriota bacterium]
MFLPRLPEAVFPFFADAGNLERITPPWLHFEILSPSPVTMQAGATIDYRLRLHGWPLHWQTIITAWDPPHRFVDEQRRGPYRVWIHEHTFRESAGGCEMEDYVKYGVFGGRLANFLLVRRDVKRIFQYRKQELMNIFNIQTAAIAGA